MRTVSVAEAKARFSAYLRSSKKGPIIVTRNGKPAGVLLAVTDEDELERLVLAYSGKFQRIMETSRRQIEKTGGIPHAEFWRQVEEDSKRRPPANRRRSGHSKRSS